MPSLTTLPDGRLAVIRVNGTDPGGKKLAKTMFELSRDGSDTLTHFDPEAHTLDALAAGIPGHVPLSCRECDETDLPDEQVQRGHSPTFRDAWEDIGPGTPVVVNMPRARIIHMSCIRVERNAELVKLDVPFTKALETGNIPEQQRIAALKQPLRDIPQTFSLGGFRTPETLKAAWPTELPPQEG
jgi:hypothetical protein